MINEILKDLIPLQYHIQFIELFEYFQILFYSKENENFIESSYFLPSNLDFTDKFKSSSSSSSANILETFISSDSNEIFYVARCFSLHSLNFYQYLHFLYSFHKFVISFSSSDGYLCLSSIFMNGFEILFISNENNNNNDDDLNILASCKIFIDLRRKFISLFVCSDDDSNRNQLFCIISDEIDHFLSSNPNFQSDETYVSKKNFIFHDIF